MKIANLIMAHKNPNQAARLVRSLAHPKCDVFIHVDKKVDIEAFRNVTNSNIMFISDRSVCNWGGFSFVQAILKSTKEILKRGKYDFVNLMSAQDYLLKPIDEIYNFFNNNRGVSFISYDVNNETDWWKDAESRYKQYHLTDFRFRGKYMLQKLLNQTMPERKIPFSHRLYGSSNSSWWTISTDCAEYLLSYLDNDKRLMRFMRYTWTADEFLIASIIMNSPFRARTINNNLRYIAWQPGSPNPITLRSSHFEALAQSDHFFARKFDSDVDEEILNKLDQLILSK